MDDFKLIDTADAARLLGVSKSLLDHDRHGGALRVPFVRMGALVRYDPQALRAWAAARMVHSPEPQAQAPQPTPEPPRRGRPRKAI